MSEQADRAKPEITAIVLWAASYTGATWISHVISAWPGIFSLGNPKTVLERLSKEPGRMCAVHRERCTLWPAFASRWIQTENLLVQLSRYVGETCFVVNNPRSREGWSVVDDPRIGRTEFAVKRDLRALAASYMRKNPDSDVVQTLEDWLLTAARTMNTDVNRDGVELIQYESVSQQPTLLIDILTKGIGHSYSSEHLRFWEHDSHVVTGNSGTLGTIATYHGMKESHQEAFYDEFLKKIRRGEDASFRDERWRKELSRYDLYVLERAVGLLNHEMGYEHDVFTEDESNQFEERFSAQLTRDKVRLSRHLGVKPTSRWKKLIGL